MIGRSKGRIRLCAALLTANLLFIWGNSLMPAEISQALSDWVRDLLSGIISGSDEPSQGVGSLRKLAHFAEFSGLGVWLVWLFGMLRATYFGTVMPTMACGFIAACIDEALQFLSPGRNPSFWDVCLDSCGVAVGMSLLLVGYTIYKKYKNKKTKTIGGKQR